MGKITSLYVGGDDSSCFGKGDYELNLATFSILSEDSIERQQPNRRDRAAAEDWLSPPIRDYRFTMIPMNNGRTPGKSLLYAMPLLIKNYLEVNNVKVNNLHLYLDGDFDSGSKKRLVDRLANIKRIEDFEVKYFIKKKIIEDVKRKNNKQKAVSKRPFCPDVVYFADVLVNGLNDSYRDYSELKSHNSLVPFS